MSLFYANATPMLKTLTDATTKFVSEVSPKWNTPLSTHLRTLIHSSDVHDLKLCWCLFFWQQHSDLPLENTTDCLSTMASVCKVMLETPWVSRCPLLLHSPVLSYCAITNSWDVFSWYPSTAIFHCIQMLVYLYWCMAALWSMCLHVLTERDFSLQSKCMCV